MPRRQIVIVGPVRLSAPIPRSLELKSLLEERCLTKDTTRSRVSDCGFSSPLLRYVRNHGRATWRWKEKQLSYESEINLKSSGQSFFWRSKTEQLSPRGYGILCEMAIVGGGGFFVVSM